MPPRLAPKLVARRRRAGSRGSALLEWLILCSLVCGVLIAAVTAFGAGVAAMFGCLGSVVYNIQSGRELTETLTGCWPAARQEPPKAGAGPRPCRRVGLASFQTQDYVIDLGQSGLEPYLVGRSSIALSLYAYAGCELTPGKMGKVACPAFGPGGAAVGYWAPEIVLPSRVRLRDVHGVGDVRGDGETTSRLMSFGVGSTPRWVATPCSAREN